MIINIITFLFHLIGFYYWICVGYCFYVNDDHRRKCANRAIRSINRGLKKVFFNRIIASGCVINWEKVTIVNSNHVHHSDTLILFELFRKFNIIGENISSISTAKNTDIFDKMVLFMNRAILVNGSNNDHKNIYQGIDILKKSSYNTALITFFEGIAKFDTNIGLIGKPKTLGFHLCNKMIDTEYMYDINIVHVFKGKYVENDKWFLYKLFHPDMKIYVDISKYKLPTVDKSVEWLNNLYILKEKYIIDKVNSIHKK